MNKFINTSSNCRMKPLVDWLSNTHWNPDTEMLTYLLLSNGTQANRDHSCPVQRCFKEFTSHQLDLSRPTVHANFARIANGAHVWGRGTYPQVLITSNPASQHTCFTPCSYSSAAATPTEWQPAPATRVTLLLPGEECERDRKCPKSNMSPPASPNHSTQTKRRTRRTH